MKQYEYKIYNHASYKKNELIESPDGNLIVLDKGEQVIKWNRVEDGLPEKDGDYLLSLYLVLFEKNIVRSGYYYKSDNEFIVNGEKCHSVTHWAELQNPKEDNNDII